MAVGVKVERFSRKLCTKDLLKEAMTSIGWRCVTKGPNLHVAQAHFKRISNDIMSRYLKSESSNEATLEETKKFLMTHEFQQCLPHPLLPRKDKVIKSFF